MGGDRDADSGALQVAANVHLAHQILRSSRCDRLAAHDHPSASARLRWQSRRLASSARRMWTRR